MAKLGLRRYLGVVEIAGSNPVAPILIKKEKMNHSEPKEIGIGLIGLGTVGSGVVKTLQARASSIARETGVKLVLRRVCVRSLNKKRAVKVPKNILTARPETVIDDPQVEILIELAGGIHPAKEWIEKAFALKKHVVTANKALLAEKGKSVYLAARVHRRRLGFEASVCGGIPILRAIREGLASDNVTHFLGIVNGTCNYILTEMSQKGLSFSKSLSEAQQKGYAEANPALDVDGVDSAHKLAVLSRLAFQAEVDFKKIHVEGIRRITAADIAYAKELGYVIKLLVIGKKKEKRLELRVHPTLLPLDHPLSSVRGVYNAVYVHGDHTGDLLFYGRGAGMMPTASAVMSDVIEIAQDMTKGLDAMRSSWGNEPSAMKILPIGDLVSKYYLRFQVKDKPGVLGSIAKILGDNKISILSVHQKDSLGSRSVPVVILTYEAKESDIRRALQKIDSSPDTQEKTQLIRVEALI